MTHLIKFFAIVSLALFFLCPFFKAQAVSLTSGLEDKAPYFASRINLRLDLRSILVDNTAMIHRYLGSEISGLEDTGFIVKRLFNNQEELGKIIGHYYGAETGEKITGLYKESISVLVGLTRETVRGDSARLTQNQERWQSDAEGIATALCNPNPQLTKATVLDLLMKHFEYVNDALNARLKSDWEAVFLYYDKDIAAMELLADTLAESIINQFPEKF